MPSRSHHPVVRRRLRARRDLNVSPLAIALQPIIDIPTGRIVAAEALARFAPGGPGVEQTFVEAHRHGRGVELELACLRAALTRRDDLPDDVWLTVNLSPLVAADPELVEVLGGDLHGIVLEITEQDLCRPDVLRRQLAPMRARGARIAVDDLGSGYAGLDRLARLRPDIIKLDRAMVARLGDTDDAMVAVIEAVVALARRLHMVVLGEGVENLDQLEALALLGVDFAQGYAVAGPSITLPGLADGVVERCRGARARMLDTYQSGTSRASHVHTRSLEIGRAQAFAELGRAVAGIAHDLRIDLGSISMLTASNDLIEVAGSDDRLDRRAYPLADYPGTALALSSGRILEAHLDDPSTDASERELLMELGFSSVLLVPLVAGDRPLGIIEFHSRDPRRWSAHHLGHVRTLADHITAALLRLRALPVDRSVLRAED